MAKAYADLTIEKGADFDKLVTWKASDETPVPLTGCTAKMQIRTFPTSPEVLVELSTENGRITLAEAGEIALHLDYADTALLDFSSAYYDLEIYAADGRPTKLLRGYIVADGEVTR